MKFVVGIGNPGKKYDGTRHNAGFDVLDHLAAKHRVARGWKEVKKLQAVTVETQQALLVKPITFVNLTGDCLAGLVREYRPKTQEILLVSDDVNLDFGKLRIREAGSAGGHHGLESAIEALGGEDFPRLRFGVRSALMPKDLNAYVLEKFTREEAEQTEAILERAVLVCESWISEGFEAAVKRLSQLQEKRRSNG